MFLIYQKETFLACLNPCSCGGWSQRRVSRQMDALLDVLILVLVEDGLRDAYRRQGHQDPVLILVLVEDGLRVICKYSYFSPDKLS